MQLIRLPKSYGYGCSVALSMRIVPVSGQRNYVTSVLYTIIGKFSSCPVFTVGLKDDSKKHNRT